MKAREGGEDQESWLSDYDDSGEGVDGRVVCSKVGLGWDLAAWQHLACELHKE